jgi:hypothetical protein
VKKRAKQKWFLSLLEILDTELGKIKNVVERLPGS